MSDPNCTPLTQIYHANKVATVCGHELHQSAFANTPYCPRCTLESAQQKWQHACDEMAHEGGTCLTSSDRSLKWSQALRAHVIARRHMDKTLESDRLRRTREQAWDEAHARYLVGESTAAMKNSQCPACESMKAATVHVPAPSADTSRTWWEHLCASTAKPQPEKSSGTSTRRFKYSTKPTASSTTQQFIDGRRLALQESKLCAQRLRLEIAVKSKFKVSGLKTSPWFWDEPFPLWLCRYNIRGREEKRLKEKRREQKKHAYPPLGSSLLSYSESADDVVTEDELIKLTEGIDMEMKKRAVSKARREVGYLYFVGINDGLQQWKDDYAQSNHGLIFRKP